MDENQTNPNPKFEWMKAAGKGFRHALVTVGSVAITAVLTHLMDPVNAGEALKLFPGGLVWAAVVAALAGTAYDRWKRV